MKATLVGLLAVILFRWVIGQVTSDGLEPTPVKTPMVTEEKSSSAMEAFAWLESAGYREALKRLGLVVFGIPRAA